MNPESHIKGTEMAQGCHFAFSVQDWSQHPSLQEFGHNCVSQTRPRLRGQKPGVRSGLVHSQAGGSLFRLLTCRILLRVHFVGRVVGCSRVESALCHQRKGTVPSETRRRCGGSPTY